MENADDEKIAPAHAIDDRVARGPPPPVDAAPMARGGTRMRIVPEKLERQIEPLEIGGRLRRAPFVRAEAPDLDEIALRTRRYGQSPADPVLASVSSAASE